MYWYIVDKTVMHLAWQTCNDLDAANISARSCCYFMRYCYTQEIVRLHWHEDWSETPMNYYAR